MKAFPNFRTVGKPPGPVSVYLICSNCDKDIRPVLLHEQIDVRRGYYCKECDDGTIHLNTPKAEK